MGIRSATLDSSSSAVMGANHRTGCKRNGASSSCSSNFQLWFNGRWGERPTAVWGDDRVRAMPVRRGLKGTTAMTLLVLGGTALLGPMPAQAAQPTAKELQKEIRQRDALIRSLVRRVDKLERQVAAGTPERGDPLPTGTPPRAR